MNILRSSSLTVRKVLSSASLYLLELYLTTFLRYWSNSLIANDVLILFPARSNSLSSSGKLNSNSAFILIHNFECFSRNDTHNPWDSFDKIWKVPSISNPSPLTAARSYTSGSAALAPTNGIRQRASSAENRRKGSESLGGRSSAIVHERLFHAIIEIVGRKV